MNRQIGKKVGTGAMYYRVYDGWDLLGEYKTGATSAYATYLYGASGVIKNLVTNNYYYQDASGSTSHLASSNGALLEWYRYDLHGTPVFYNSLNQQRSTTNYGVRHLFTGQQWYSELGLYDLRNRYYSPDIGRFLQGDPASFGGDATNLYRYCGNNPLTRSDANGTEVVFESGKITVWGDYDGPYIDHFGDSFGNLFGSPISGFPGAFPGENPFNTPIHLTPQTGVAPKFIPTILPAFNPTTPYTAPNPPAANQTSTASVLTSVSNWARDHLSIDANVNGPIGGVNIDGSSKGVYMAGGPGPGDVGEATLTANVNLGTPPQGFYGAVSGAIGWGPAGRFTVGWAPGTGFYGNFGVGYGYAVYFGGTTPGYGGYVYTPGPE